jgi:hypothetical protein
VLTYIEADQDQEQNTYKVLLAFIFFGTWTSKPINIGLLLIGPSPCSKDVGVSIMRRFGGRLLKDDACISMTVRLTSLMSLPA